MCRFFYRKQIVHTWDKEGKQDNYALYRMWKVELYLHSKIKYNFKN